MGDRILVTYATFAGSTAGVAEAIGETLRKTGATVNVLPMKQVRSLDGYRAVAAGTAVRAGKVHGDAPKFFAKHAGALAKLPVAYFVVCLTMKDPTEANRCTVEAYLDVVRKAAPQVQPVGVGLFAGALDYSKLGFPFGWIMKKMKAEAGDFRDWEAIRAWATEIAPALSATGASTR